MINIKIIKRLIEKTVREAEEEAVFAGVDINTPEFEQVIFTLKKKLLERLGVDFDEYRNIVKNLSETSKEKADEKRTIEVKRIENELRKYLESELKNIEERQRISKEQIREIALDVAKNYVQPPQIINQIVKEIEKPTIVEKNFTIKEQSEYDDKPLKKELRKLETKIEQIKPRKIDSEEIKEDLKGYFNEQLEKNINILGMPDFRKLGMGLDSRISALESSSPDLSGYVPYTGATTNVNLGSFDLSVADEAYNATTWDGSLEVPTKNAIRDKIEGSGWITGLDWGQLGATATQQRVDDNASIGMADGATTLRFRSGGYDDKNYIEVYGGDNASLVNPSFRSEGAGTNVGIDFHTKGRQYFQFRGTRDSAAEIRIFENSLLGNDYVGLTVAEDTASYTLQLPNTAPSDQFIVYDASGIGTWQTYTAPTVDGSGTTNEIAYWVDGNTLGALTTATYPSLTELSYVKGVTSAIQTQLNNKQPLDTQLTDLAGLSYTGNSLKVVRVNAGETGWELATIAAGGDVTKVGTPVNNQMAVWTGDGTLEGTSDFTYDGTSLNLITGKNFQIAGTTILADAAGTTTLSGIDALDATTESTIEGAIDTLANLTSIQGRTVTLADAGANAIFGWDDVAGAYENLTQAEVLGVIGNAAADGTTKGVAGFNATNFTASSGIINTVQNITTTSNPQFATLEIGNASDTTLSRSAAGILAVEGVPILKSSAGVGTTPTSSSTTTITHGLGRAPVIIRIKGKSGFTSSASATPTTSSEGIWNSSGNFCIYQSINGTTTIAAQTSNTFAIFLDTSVGNTISGVIQNITSTQFDIVWTETGTHTRGVYMWEAQ